MAGSFRQQQLLQTMAQSDDWLQQSFRIIWILAIFTTQSRSKKTQTFYMQDADCGARKTLGGATVFSHSGAIYRHRVDCRMTFRARTEGWRLMLRLERMDVPDMAYNQLCNDALYVYDSQTILGRPVAGMSAGGVCGDQVPAVMYSSGPFLTVYFRTDKTGPRGAGFKFVVTAFSEDKDACSKRFLCENRKCIERDLICDEVDHCGDSSDESKKGLSNCRHLDVKDKSSHNNTENTIVDRLLSLGITAAIAIAGGGAIIIIICVVCSICCCCRLVKKSDQEGGATPGGGAGGGACNHGPVPVNNGSQPTGPTTYQHCSYPTAAPPNSNGGYYPMYHVPPSVPPGGARSSDDSAKPLVTYSPFKQAGPQQGAPLCPQPPPSYHRSYTPTSSRSGRSHNSGESAVKYDITHKVALPVHL